MTIMCNLVNYQNRDLKENLQQRKKQAEKTDAEIIEIGTMLEYCCAAKEEKI